jgi:hypothetical protein
MRGFSMRLPSRMTVLPPIALALAIGPLARVVHADPLYQVTDLGAVAVNGLNNAGQVLLGKPFNNHGVFYSPSIYYSYGPQAGQGLVQVIGCQIKVERTGKLRINA